MYISMAQPDLKSRVVHAIGVRHLVLLVRLVVVACLRKCVLVGENNLVWLLDILHAETLADVPCNVAVL